MERSISAEVKGMHCTACSTRIERVVAKLSGISDVAVNLATESISVSFDDNVIKINQIVAQIQSLGFEMMEGIETKNSEVDLEISGMHCASCSSRIERVVSSMDGVHSATVNLASEKGSFIYDSSATGLRSIKRKIADLGFDARISSRGLDQIEKKEEETLGRLAQEKREVSIKLLLLFPLLYLSMGEMVGVSPPAFLSVHSEPLHFGLAQFFLTLPIMWFGRHFYLIGFPALLRKAPNMDSLIAVGTGAAFVYSCWNLVEIILGISPHERGMDLYFESVGVLIALVSLGKYLESKSKHRTSDAIRKLMQLAPKTALLVSDDRQEVIDVEEIEEGDILLVKSGATIPTDGEIILGKTEVDESSMTGESLPVSKSAGDTVFGGTVNSHNTIHIRAGRSRDNTLLAQIIRMVQQAQGSKPPIARIADQVSYYFVPAVMLFAVLTGISWYLLSDVGFSQSLRFFISVMVIACPCAMGLATPISVMVGTGRGAQLGILVKNGETLEKLEKVKTIFFDKTGTITVGKPEVVDLNLRQQFSANTLVKLVASAEQSSEHPLAEAIVRYAHKKQLELTMPQEFETFSGQGIQALVNGSRVCIGNKDFIFSLVNGGGEFSEKDSYSLDGRTVLYVGVDDQFAGQIIVADKIKPGVDDVVSRLRRWGAEVVMLTGDNRKTAEAIGVQAGIDKIIAEVLPDKKADVVADYQKKTGLVAMAGDGINDAPALAQADIGIAMGTGIDIAIDSADVVLMKGDLAGVVTALHLSQAVMKNVRQNLFWAFGYNILGLPVAAGVLFLFGGPALNPMFAGAAMALSSVSVVSNALRLRFFK